MKKLIITTVTALMFSVLSFAQSGLNIGGSIGFPYENYEGNYLFEVNSAFDLGIATGYGQAIGDSYYVGPIIGNFETPDYQYVPVAGAARFSANEKLVFGADIGYAISVSSAKDLYNNDYYTGGFYWRPMVGFNINETLQLNANYIGISDDYFYYGSFNLGLTININ